MPDLSKWFRGGSEHGCAKVILEADQRWHVWNRGYFSEYITHRPHPKTSGYQIKQANSSDLVAATVSEPLSQQLHTRTYRKDRCPALKCVSETCVSSQKFSRTCFLISLPSADHVEISGGWYLFPGMDVDDRDFDAA
jgi:hypothetical protein